MPGDRPHVGPLIWLIILVVLVVVIVFVVVLRRDQSPSLDVRQGTPHVAVPVAAPTPARPAAPPGTPATDADMDDILAPHAVPGIAVLRRVGYQIGYETKRQRPRWAVYSLPARVVEPGKQPKRPAWVGDDRVADPITEADWVGCGKRGYDRGHLAPSDALWSRYGHAGWKGTYVLTNVVPERRGMNGGRWSHLEGLLAGRGPTDTGLAGRCGYLAVAVVPIYDDSADLDGDGVGRDTLRIQQPVEIPDAVASIALDRTSGGYRAWAWVTPNTDQGVLTLTSVRDIEQLSGFDFDDELPPTLQAAFESVVLAAP